VRRTLLAVCSLLIFLRPVFAGTAILNPTTTLAAETGNNTSTANSFAGEVNGNIAATNVSKVPTSSLLYPGAKTKIYAHFMPWFGVSYHVNVGYSSSDPAQVKAQVSDMLSRGISGMIIDWYGPSSYEDQVSLVIKPEAESRNGQFEFAIMEDAGSKTLSGCSTNSTCTSKLITDLNYIYNTYESSPAYMRWNGQPVVFFFSVEQLPIDWNAVRAGIQGNPIFIFQNSGGFTRTYSNGGFSWVMPSDTSSTDPIAAGYLDNFYSTALAYPAKLPFATGYKGFDDSIASWTANRYMQQQCGQTWLSSLAEISKYYSVGNQLPTIQLVTWNDYEEGTEIESGIDNCLSISATVSGSTLSWSISGQENTLDHYTVFISNDGQNLMSLGDYPTGTHSLDLSTFGFVDGTYTVYVKAVGKPSIVNHLSGPATYAIGSIVNQPPLARLSITPASGSVPLVVTASTASSSDPDGTIASSTINWGDGSSSAGPTASHTYGTAGTYTVTGTVVDNKGASANASASVTATVTAQVTILSPANNATVSPKVHVVANGVAPTPIDALQIYLDGNFIYEIKSASMDTVITAAPGAHRLVVKMWQTNGTTTMQAISVTVVDQPPVALLDVTPTSGIGPLTVSASTAGSSDPDGTISSSSIDFGDGTIVSGANAAHTYSNAGSYSVKGTVTDEWGKSSSASTTVTVSTATTTTRTMTLTSPINNSVLSGGQVHVVGSVTSSVPVDALQIYIDGVVKYQVRAMSLDTWLPLKTGTHRVTFKAWDINGASWMKSVYVTMQ
jgi:PKD repeat protein